jgi:hypothetical protein
MAGGPQLLIDQALDELAAAPPPRLGDRLQITPEQALVWSVYLSVLDKRQGLPGSGDTSIERDMRAASRAGLPEHEILAAVARGEAAGEG